MLDSESFSKAHSLRRFLAYVVDETLAGRADALKEYAIGVEVFGRGEGFDPRADTIVRVQARRLRSKLEQVLAAAGHPDGVAIHVPTGSYLPRFREVPAAPHARGAAAGRTGRGTGLGRPAAGGRATRRPALPVPRTTLIGREAEVAAILGVLRGGGCRRPDAGRARRQRQDAPGAAGRRRSRAEGFPGGVSFVGLGSLADAADVAPTLAQALGLSRIERGSVEDALRAHVRACVRDRTLLVLDNFEQLLAAAPLLVALVEATAALTLLVTSRAVLHVTGEQCFRCRRCRCPTWPACRRSRRSRATRPSRCSCARPRRGSRPSR